jgi:hypothetical protein
MGLLLSKTDLLDPAKFHTLPQPLTCFKPHVRKVRLPGHDRPVQIKVTSDDIYEIARHAREMQQRGIFPRITDGHVNTEPRAREQAQPALIGFASDPEIAIENAQPVLRYKWHVKHQYLPILKHRPHRSAEYMPHSKEIRGIAVLLRDPALDMGTLYYERGGELVYFYGVNNMANDPAGGKPDEQKPGDSTDSKNTLLQEVCAYLESKYAGLAALAAGPSVPTGDTSNLNAAIPALYQRQVDTLAAQVKEMTEQRDTEQCVWMVSQLIAERYQLNPQVEIEQLKLLPADKRQTRVDYIRQYYQQLPGGTPINVAQGAVPYHLLPNAGNPTHFGALTKAQADAVIQYQAEHPGVSFEDAKRVVLK